jgi:hypothetical protein
MKQEHGPPVIDEAINNNMREIKRIYTKLVPWRQTTASIDQQPVLKAEEQREYTIFQRCTRREE